MDPVIECHEFTACCCRDVQGWEGGMDDLTVGAHAVVSLQQNCNKCFWEVSGVEGVMEKEH
jgi:hypothetical protein